MKTNEQILNDITARGYMTEREMLTLKARSNNAQSDAINYDVLNEGFALSPEWAAKGIQWLKSLLKSNGEPRKGQPLGYREIEIIKTATPEDFSFIGFYDAGRYFRNYIPLYRVAGMDYYYNAGRIEVIG